MCGSVVAASGSTHLIGDMLGQSSILLGNLKAAIPALSSTATHPEWQTLEDIDVPLYRRHLSAAIDKAAQLRLLSTASSIHERAL